MLERAARHNITFVMVTHEPELASCGDRIVTLKDGHVISNELLDDETKRLNREKLFASVTEDDLIPAEPDTDQTEDQAENKH